MSGDVWSGLDDVDFDFGAARALQNAASTAAMSANDALGSITTSSAAALQDFNGYFSNVFRGNVATAKTDGQNIATCLEELSKYSGELVASAQEENKRRAHARAWLEEQRTFNTLPLRGDSSLAIPNEPMPYAIDESGPCYSVDDVSLRARAEPVRGSVGGGGTSSANPGNLRQFSSMVHAPGFSFGSSQFGGSTRLSGAWSDFLAGCHWGTLTDGGVCAAVDKWFTANSIDME